MQMLKDVIELAQKYHTKVSHRNKLRKISLLLADANVERRNRARAKNTTLRFRHRNKLQKLSLLLADANVERRNRARAKNTTLSFLTAINYGNYLFS